MNKNEQKIEFNSAYISKRRSRLRTVHNTSIFFRSQLFGCQLVACLSHPAGFGLAGPLWVISILVRARGLKPRHFVHYRLDNVTFVMWLGVDNSLEPTMGLLLQNLVHEKNAVDEINPSFFIQNWPNMTQEGACRLLAYFRWCLMP